MAAHDLQPSRTDPDITERPETAEPTPSLPDYLASPDAVFGDEGVQWRYGRAPDYTKTRKVWAEGKTMNHAAGSLPQLVENLVKNWEVEASFKPRLSDWRTIDHENYSFAMGGGPSQSAEQMIKVGTYNGIIAPNEYYSPENSDFNSSHKTFKRMMPAFAWEVLEVYSGPPRVSFRWRHWGVMKNDYVGFNNKGEKVTAKAHGGLIDIQGVTVAEVDEKIRMRAIQTWMDPLEMFRQIAPYGIVSKATMNRKVDPEAALDDSDSGTVVSPEDKSETVPQEPSPARTFNAAVTPTELSPDQLHDDATAASGNVSRPSHMEEISIVPATPENTAAPEHLETAQEVAEASLPEAHAMLEGVSTHAADIEIEKQETKASKFTQALCHVPVAARSYNYGPIDQRGDHIADVPRSIYSSTITGNVEDVLLTAGCSEVKDESKADGVYDLVDEYLAEPAEVIHPDGHEVLPVGNALAASPHSQETRIAHEEMSGMLVFECPFLQNRE